jgi:NAD(P)-dependent dehydrogenase (short-subunit alcohol dehydrogenase family)
MNGSVVLVTGAASGVGRAAELFSDYGARVVAADRSESAAETADAGGKAIAVQADLSVESDVERMVAAAVGTPGALNAAFNNAGHRAACRPVRTQAESCVLGAPAGRVAVHEARAGRHGATGAQRDREHLSVGGLAAKVSGGRVLCGQARRRRADQVHCR